MLQRITYLGTASANSCINPSSRDTNSIHPIGNISLGQVLPERVYDAVRTDSQWGKTLFYITFHETSGFFDNIAPPLAIHHDSKIYTVTALDGNKYTLNYDRVGGSRLTWLPPMYAPQRYIENYSINPARNFAYNTTSVLKAPGYLRDLANLTPRVSYSLAFDHFIGPKNRSASRLWPTSNISPMLFDVALCGRGSCGRLLPWIKRPNNVHDDA